ncbi:MAG: immunoglobulin-like domain-containing protein, partial [Roseiarcus sp.]
MNGDNPAIIQVGATYTDLGATITGPQADLNLGIKTFLNGALVSNIVLDTSAAATDTIDYVVADSQGLTATSTRTVIIQAANDNQASNTPANDNTVATTT